MGNPPCVGSPLRGAAALPGHLLVAPCPFLCGPAGCRLKESHSQTSVLSPRVTSRSQAETHFLGLSHKPRKDPLFPQCLSRTGSASEHGRACAPTAPLCRQNSTARGQCRVPDWGPGREGRALGHWTGAQPGRPVLRTEGRTASLPHTLVHAHAGRHTCRQAHTGWHMHTHM